MYFSYLTGSLFNNSIYDGLLRTKNIPIIKKTTPKETANITAYTVMCNYVKTFKMVTPVSEIAQVLKSTDHNGFPVVT